MVICGQGKSLFRPAGLRVSGSGLQGLEFTVQGFESIRF